jgi:hypothetical protein
VHDRIRVVAPEANPESSQQQVTAEREAVVRLIRVLG